jgi:putative transposase
LTYPGISGPVKLECLAIDVAGSIRSRRVIEVLSQLISVHGAPRYLRSDNGPEFVSHAILKWAADNGLDMALSDPDKPWQNGTDESFNGKFAMNVWAWSGSAHAPRQKW